jgi:hypothetical protein
VGGWSAAYIHFDATVCLTCYEPSLILMIVVAWEHHVSCHRHVLAMKCLSYARIFVQPSKCWQPECFEQDATSDVFLKPDRHPYFISDRKATPKSRNISSSPSTSPVPQTICFVQSRQHLDKFIEACEETPKSTYSRTFCSRYFRSTL